jgi:hypothetical protein
MAEGPATSHLLNPTEILRKHGREALTEVLSAEERPFMRVYTVQLRDSDIKITYKEAKDFESEYGASKILFTQVGDLSCSSLEGIPKAYRSTGWCHHCSDGSTFPLSIILTDPG